MPSELVSVKSPAETVTLARVEEGTKPSTRGSSNGPVLVQPQVGAGRLLAITIGRFKFVTPSALVPVSIKVKGPGEGDAEVKTVRVAETLPVDGTVRLVGPSVNVTPEGAAPVQAALSCTISLTPLTERSVISEVSVEEAFSRGSGAAEA